MRALGDGWWEAPAASAGDDPLAGYQAGYQADDQADYQLVVDGELAIPDPRSPFQPHGVHGPSRRDTAAGFRWTDEGWRAPPLSAAVIYELHVGTFTPQGTFESAIARLDHLVRLGVTHVEIMPVAAFPGSRGWGYDGVALFAPHAAYGGPAGLKRLVDACHARGLAVLLDVVYNHLGPDGNYLGRLGPYFTDRYHTPWGDAVNFDGRGSDEVRRFFCDNALFWLREYHLDGLRLDAVHAIIDTSARHVLEQLADEVAALAAAQARPLVLIAESDLNDPRLVRTPEAGGYGLDAQWSDDFHHALHVLLTGERDGYYADYDGVADLATALRQGFVVDGRHAPSRGRHHGRRPAGVSGHRLVGFAQNHDQVGNRARGERLSQLVDAPRQKLAAALVLTAPLVPLLFMGEEWGAGTPFLYFTDHEDPALADAVRDGRRREFAAFGWDPETVPDPQAASSFERSKLDWDEPGRAPHRELLDWYTRLIALRRGTPALLDGRFENARVAWDEARRWIRMERGPVTVAFNVGPEAADVPLGPERPRTPALLSSDGVRVEAGAVRLPPWGVAILGGA